MEGDFVETLEIIPTKSGERFASETSTLDSTLTPTNSTWCINQQDANDVNYSSDDVNNNCNANTSTFVGCNFQKNHYSSTKEQDQEDFLTCFHHKGSSTPLLGTMSDVSSNDVSRLLLSKEMSELRCETLKPHKEDHALLRGCNLEEESNTLSLICEEFLGVRENVIHSVIGETFQAYPARKRCSSYIEYSDYDETNAPCLSDGGTSTHSFDFSESETDSPSDQLDCVETITSISALNGLTKEQVISESKTILQKLYDENMLLRDQCANVEKLLSETTETRRQLQYDLNRKDRLLQELCVELDEKNVTSSNINPDKTNLNVSRCEMQEKILQLKDENEAYKTGVDRLQAKKEKWKTQKQLYEKQIKHLQDEVSSGKEDLRRNTEECQKDENNMKELLNTIKDLKLVIRHLTVENLELLETIHVLKDSKDKTIEDELRRQRDKCDELQEQLVKVREEQNKTFSESWSLNNLDLISDSDDSLFSQIRQSVENVSELPAGFTPVHKRTKSVFHVPRQRRPLSTRRRAVSMCETQNMHSFQENPRSHSFQENQRSHSFQENSFQESSCQEAHQADEQIRPKISSLFSSTSILNRVGLLVMGLGALGAGTMVPTTNLEQQSSLEMGKPGTPGSGDLEDALTRLSGRNTASDSLSAMTVLETSDLHSVCDVSTTSELQHENNHLSNHSMTSSVFRYMASLTKPASVTSSCALNPVFHMDRNKPKKRHSFAGTSPLIFLSSMRGTMPLSKNSLISSSPDPVSEEIITSKSTKVSKTICSNNPQGMCSSESAVEAVSDFSNSHSGETPPPETRTFPRTTSCPSVLGALKSFKQTGRFN